MGKVALVFSGQGSQYIGMGKDLFESYEVCKNIYQVADEVLGKSVSTLSFAGEADVLNDTVNAQTAILTHSIACLELLKSQNISYDGVLGFSLGEYSALVAANVLNFENALKLVDARSNIMSNAVKNVSSGMAAVVGLSFEEVEARLAGICAICNYNSSKQIVIGGTMENLQAVEKLFADAKFVYLNVSGAFHSYILDDAAKEFQLEVEKYSLNDQTVPVMSNYTGNYYSQITSEILSKQMNNTVKFYDNVKNMLEDGYDTFIELGPGKVISSFVKSIGRDLGIKPNVYNIENVSSFNKLLEKIGG